MRRRTSPTASSTGTSAGPRPVVHAAGLRSGGARSEAASIPGGGFFFPRRTTIRSRNSARLGISSRRPPPHAVLPAIQDQGGPKSRERLRRPPPAPGPRRFQTTRLARPSGPEHFSGKNDIDRTRKKQHVGMMRSTPDVVPSGVYRNKIGWISDKSEAGGLHGDVPGASPHDSGYSRQGVAPWKYGSLDVRVFGFRF